MELAWELIVSLSQMKRKFQLSQVAPVAPENQQAHANVHMGLAKGMRCKGHLKKKKKKKKKEKGNSLWVARLEFSPVKNFHASFYSTMPLQQPQSPQGNGSNADPESEKEAISVLLLDRWCNAGWT